jgi:dTDP-4-dehydrorhamnose reductase
MSGTPHGPIWITGGLGLIGHCLTLSAPQYAPTLRARPLARGDLDLTRFDDVARLFEAEHPSAVIHCAALSRNPDCEANPALARRINVEATAHLAELAAAIPFIFFSTDLVFDGEKGCYREDDPLNPLSVYGETKANAEQAVRQNPLHAIVRISLTGGISPKGDRGFNEEMKNAWRAGKTLNLFTDEFRCPAPATIVARAIWDLLQKGAAGVFHLCGAEKLSRYEIGRLLAEAHPELRAKIQPGSRNEYQGPPRPRDTSMDCSKIQRLLSFPPPRFSEWLRADATGF